MEEKNMLHKLLKLWFRQKSGEGLEAKLGYRFKDPELLAHALVHRSFLSGRDLPYESNNERLEFLGDSVLNMLTTEYLYRTFPDDPEGELSKRKSAIVSGHACAQSSKEWDLGEYVKIGKAEAKMGGRGKESILADAYEAVLGAVYLDGGLDAARHQVVAHALGFGHHLVGTLSSTGHEGRRGASRLHARRVKLSGTVDSPGQERRGRSVLAQAAPDFIDSILYTPEELRIINYQ